MIRLHKAFTLVELLISMAAGSMVLLIAASLLGMTGESYNRLGGNMDTDREARALMFQISSDFSSAVFHKDQKFTSGSGTWRKDDAGFLTLLPDGAQSEAGRNGDLCAVHYYVADLSVNGRTTRCLMRGVRESAETMRGVISNQVASLFAKNPNLDEPVAFGVLSFEASLLKRDNSGNWQPWTAPASTTGTSNDVPEACSMRVILAGKEAIARLKTSDEWDGAASVLTKQADPSRNKNLRIYRSILPFSHVRN